MTVLSATARAALVAVATGVALVVLAPPASAHAGGTAPSNWMSTVDAVAPPMAGVTVRTVEFGNYVRLTNSSSVVVTVPGYDGEPYLRIGPGGVEENERSPATFLNRTKDSRTPVPDSAADPVLARKSPQWRRVSSSSTWRWHDHRTHWMERTPPPIVRAEPHRAHEIVRWQLDLWYGQMPVAVTGRLVWMPPPSPWPYLAIGLGLAALGAAAGLLPRGWRMMVVTLLGLLVLAVVAHAAAERSLVGVLSAFVGCGLAAFTLVALLRRLPLAPYALALTGTVVLSVDGLAGLGVLTSSQLPSGGPAWLIRLSVAAALGLGLGLILAGWQVWRREQPVPAPAAPTRSAARTRSAAPPAGP